MTVGVFLLRVKATSDNQTPYGSSGILVSLSVQRCKKYDREMHLVPSSALVRERVCGERKQESQRERQGPPKRETFGGLVCKERQSRDRSSCSVNASPCQGSIRMTLPVVLGRRESLVGGLRSTGGRKLPHCLFALGDTLEMEIQALISQGSARKGTGTTGTPIGLARIFSHRSLECYEMLCMVYHTMLDSRAIEQLQADSI